jgi:UDP-glucose 4-epimerase
VRILVTGGAGFIGSHLARALLNAGHDVRVYDDLSMGRAENVPDGAEFVRGDVLDLAELRKATADVDIVCHLAARVSVRASMDSFVDDARVNLLGTLTVLSALSGSRVQRLVFASSMAVYADSPTAAPVGENHPTEPISPYGISKLAAEKYIRLMSRQLGTSAVILRFFNTYGAGQSYTPYVGVITIFVRRLLNGEPIVIYGDGEQRRDFVSVHDVVRATVTAATRSDVSGVINVGSGMATSVNEIATMLVGRLAPGTQPRYAAPQGGELRNAVADIGRARAVLAYQPSDRLDDRLDELIGWQRRIAGIV